MPWVKIDQTEQAPNRVVEMDVKPVWMYEYGQTLLRGGPEEPAPNGGLSWDMLQLEDLQRSRSL